MCILVVEDDFLIRKMLVEDLLDAGYEVEEAESGDAARRLLVAIHGRVKVLITDIHMPGQWDGVALAAHLQGVRPDIPVIFTTGRPDALGRTAPLTDKQRLVRKPYVPREVIAHVETMIGGS